MLKFARRFQSTLVKADTPASMTRVASSQSSLYEIQNYSNEALKSYFDEDALLFPVETIIEKTAEKDYKFFLTQDNFLKVTDTLEKFEDNILDKDSEGAREFTLFKQNLYKMYEVQNRSVPEHELYSFNIDRHNLTLVARANQDYLDELLKEKAIHRLADHASLGGDAYKRKWLNPRRLQGLGAFAVTGYIYWYLPYISVMTGPTLPVLAGVITGLAGMMSWAESELVNTITTKEDGTIVLNVATSPLASKDIEVHPQDLQAVHQIDNIDTQLLMVLKHVDTATGETVDKATVFGLSADAFKDETYTEWLLSRKSGGELDSLYNDLLKQSFEQARDGKISQ